MPAGGACAWSPQQTSVPSVLTAHATPDPALTEVKVPPGTVDRPSESSSLHTTVPSVLTPHTPGLPTLTEVKLPAGGFAGPPPQQAMVWSALTPQPALPRSPMLTEVKRPDESRRAPPTPAPPVPQALPPLPLVFVRLVPPVPPPPKWLKPPKPVLSVVVEPAKPCAGSSVVLPHACKLTTSQKVRIETERRQPIVANPNTEALALEAPFQRGRMRGQRPCSPTPPIECRHPGGDRSAFAQTGSLRRASKPSVSTQRSREDIPLSLGIAHTANHRCIAGITPGERIQAITRRQCCFRRR